MIKATVLSSGSSTLSISLGFALGFLWAYPLALSAETGDPSRLDPRRIGWQRLRFSAAKVLVSGTAEVGFEILAADAAVPDLSTTPDGLGLGPRGTQVGRVNVVSRLGSRETRESVWFDPLDGAALERRKLKVGRKGYTRTERFTAVGIHRTRRAPANQSESRLPADSWSQKEVGFQSFGEGVAGLPVIHPLTLFYLASVAPLEEVGDRFEAAIFSRDRLVPFSLEVSGVEMLAVRFEEVQGDRVSARTGKVEAIRIRIVDAGGDDGDFRFLGLKDGVEIWLERASRVPVLVRGRMSFLGRVDVTLSHVTLVPMAAPVAAPEVGRPTTQR